MTDPTCSALTTALDRLADGAIPAPAAALAESDARRARLARSGVEVAESPYLHFLRRFAAEPAAPVLAASA
jgi:hypothetical protein